MQESGFLPQRGPQVETHSCWQKAAVVLWGLVSVVGRQLTASATYKQLSSVLLNKWSSYFMCNKIINVTLPVSRNFYGSEIWEQVSPLTQGLSLGGSENDSSMYGLNWRWGVCSHEVLHEMAAGRTLSSLQRGRLQRVVRESSQCGSYFPQEQVTQERNRQQAGRCNACFWPYLRSLISLLSFYSVF